MHAYVAQSMLPADMPSEVVDLCCLCQLQGAVERVPSFSTEVDPVMERKYKDNFYAAVSLRV